MGVLLGALLLMALLGPLPAGAGPATETIHVTADHPVRFYLRARGENTWRPVGEGMQATIPVRDLTEYDVLAEGPADFFHLWRGEQTKVYGGQRFSLETLRVLSWPRVLLFAIFPPLGLALLLALRLRRERNATLLLADRLEEAEGYATLRPGVIPRRIGPYRVLERVGSGGTATVYRVEDAHGDVYALKVPERATMDDEDSRARFFREMEIGRTLHHAGIARIYEVHPGDSETWPYIAQEFVDGGTLRDLLRRDAPLAEGRALFLAGRVAEVLAFAHARGIVHRDVKPSNVMLTRAGDVKVMDFGIARSVAFATITGTDATLGTPAYMAPEQVSSHQATVRSDLYSLGVVLFEMLTARLPFTDAEPYRLLAAKMHQEAPRVSRYRHDVTRRVDNLVAMLLQADPQRRPASAEQAARMLALLQEEEAPEKMEPPDR